MVFSEYMSFSIIKWKTGAKKKIAPSEKFWPHCEEYHRQVLPLVSLYFWHWRVVSATTKISRISGSILCIKNWGELISKEAFSVHTYIIYEKLTIRLYENLRNLLFHFVKAYVNKSNIAPSKNSLPYCDSGTGKGS